MDSFCQRLYRLIPLLLFVGCCALSARAQTFQKGLQLYEDEEFAKAAALFDKIHTTRALLFAGKSYYGMQDYVTAKSRLLEALDQGNAYLATEARYTLSLVHIKQKNFDEALFTLAGLTRQTVSTEVARQSKSLYQDLLKYLTFNQRKNILEKAESDSLKYDLVVSALGRISTEDARTLFSMMRSSTDIASNQLEEVASVLEDKSHYQSLQERRNLEAPAGLTYTVGIALPAYAPSRREYDAAQGLYLGFTLAAEQFNESDGPNVSLAYQNTGTQTDIAQKALENFAAVGVDAIWGPLFSERAKTMAQVAEQYKIPIVAPLANAESIPNEDGYLFQVNSTFSVHGKSMAQYAANSLNLDKVAVITESGSVGETAARSFREKMKKEGGKVPYFFVENLGSRGYGLSKYTRYFSTERAATAKSAVSAVYAPFTGDQASTLMDVLLGQLNSLESEVVVLGTPEWANAGFASDKIGDRSVYFTEGVYIPSNSSKITRFKSAFRQRFHKEANRFAMIGYDMATFFLQTLQRVVNPELLKEGLSKQKPYDGLVTNIYFDGTNVNQRLMLFTINKSGTYLISE